MFVSEGPIRFERGPLARAISGLSIECGRRWTDCCPSWYPLLPQLPPSMASRLMLSSRTGLALVAGCLLFVCVAAASAHTGTLSVGEIEEQLQVT